MIRILYKNEQGFCCAAAEFLQFTPDSYAGDGLPDHVWFYAADYLVEIEVDDQFLDDIFMSATVRGYVDLSDCRLLSETKV